MDLRDYLRVLRKGWVSILAFVIVGITAGVGLTLATTKVYEGTVQIIVSATGASGASDANQANSYALATVQSITALANSPLVTKPVIESNDKDVKSFVQGLTQSELSTKISADAPLNKVLINIHVTDTNPATAAGLANAVGDSFVNVAGGLAKTDSTGTPVLSYSVFFPATVPSSPIKPNKILNLGLGLVVGLLIGVGVAVLREVLDNTVNGPEDFEQIGMPVLGLVPFDKRTPRAVIAFRNDPHSARSEAYRQLRTNLQFVDVDNPPRIIAVTSAIPGEGKSTTAINLAAALAEAGSRVCLVEADLRRPSMAKALGLVGDVGFTTVVIGKAPVETVLQNAGRNLAVLTSGPVPPNPSELLISDHAKQVIADLAKNVDFLIIDTPPLLPVTDGAELATIADATLLVHRAEKTTRDQAMRSIQALEKVGRRPVGVILNMITRGSGRYDSGYSYYTTYRPDSNRSKDAPDGGQGAVEHAGGDTDHRGVNGFSRNGRVTPTDDTTLIEPVDGSDDDPQGSRRS